MPENNTHPISLADVFGGESLSCEQFTERAAALGYRSEDAAAVRAEYEKKLEGVRRSAALERELDRAGAKNRSLVSRVIDMDKVTVGEAGVSGIAEQLAALKKSDPYLFETPEGVRTAGAPSGLSHGEGALDADSLNDAEYYRLVKKL